MANVKIHITNVRYPVSQDVIRQVFEPVAPIASFQNIQNHPDGNVTAYVTFNDINTAQNAVAQRNGRCIYADCNQMSVSVMQNQQPQQQMGGALLPPPQHHMAGMIPPQQQQGMMMAQPQMQMGMPSQGMMAPQAGGMLPPQGGMMSHQGGMMQPGYGAPGMQQAGYDPTRGRGRGFGRGRGMDRGRGGYNQGYNQGQDFNAVGGRGYGGDRGYGADRGRGGYQQQGFLPNRGGRGGGGRFGGDSQYVSLNNVPEEVPLQRLYNLLEAFGAVLWIKRNAQPRRAIVTVKMASNLDAKNIPRVIYRVPLYGPPNMQAKMFPDFVERTEVQANGDPSDPSVTEFNFENAAHRQAMDRTPSEIGVTDTLTVHNISHKTDLEVYGFFSENNCNPDQIFERNGDALTVLFRGKEDAVKALVEFNGAVCGEAASVLKFAKSKSAPEAALNSDNTNQDNAQDGTMMNGEE